VLRKRKLCMSFAQKRRSVVLCLLALSSIMRTEASATMLRS
jgi:hypothetical protein